MMDKRFYQAKGVNSICTVCSRLFACIMCTSQLSYVSLSLSPQSPLSSGFFLRYPFPCYSFSSIYSTHCPTALWIISTIIWKSSRNKYTLVQKLKPSKYQQLIHVHNDNTVVGIIHLRIEFSLLKFHSIQIYIFKSTNLFTSTTVTESSCLPTLAQPSNPFFSFFFFFFFDVLVFGPFLHGKKVFFWIKQTKNIAECSWCYLSMFANK